MAKKVYSKQQAQDAAEAWERWCIASRESGESLGHPIPFMKLYTALMEMAEKERDVLRWLFPDTPEKVARYGYVQSMIGNAIQMLLVESDIHSSHMYICFLYEEYVQHVLKGFTQISLQEQVGYPLVEGGGPIPLEEAGVVEGVVIDEI